jgi:hypothetical protein
MGRRRKRYAVERIDDYGYCILYALFFDWRIFFQSQPDVLVIWVCSKISLRFYLIEYPLDKIQAIHSIKIFWTF